jgi:hypothetical protein
MVALGHPHGLDVTLVDGDRISRTNCVRQPFSESEIGLHKATVLATRINLFWGLGWKGVPHFVNESWGQDTDILIGCVDSRAAVVRNGRSQSWSTRPIAREQRPLRSTLGGRRTPVLYRSKNFYSSRRAGSPDTLIGQLKSAVDRDVSLQITELAARISKSLSRERLLAALAGIFGNLALVLAMMGLYGVMSYNTARRQNEIAIRMALGSSRSRLFRAIMGEVAILMGAGLVVGMVLAMITTRFLATLLYQLKPNDPGTLALAATLLSAVGQIRIIRLSETAIFWPLYACKLDQFTVVVTGESGAS